MRRLAAGLTAGAAGIALVAFTGNASGGDPRAHAEGGMIVGASADSSRVLDIGTVYPSSRVLNAGYQSGGVGLRNQRKGGIEISGVTGPPITSYIYWAFITTGPPTAAQATIRVIRRWPEPAAGATRTGAIMGQGLSPCWAGDTITVFRATLPNNVTTGNGFYEVVLDPGSAASFAGEDPWVSSVAPMAEGASIVTIYQSGGTVAVFDRAVGAHPALSGQTSGTGFDYDLRTGNPPVPGGNPAQIDMIGADGQMGASRFASASGEVTSVNGTPIAGPGAAYSGSDWDGSSGLPLPQLWDDIGHDISGLIGGPQFNVNVSAPTGDCLTPVANVVRWAP